MGRSLLTTYLDAVQSCGHYLFKFLIIIFNSKCVPRLHAFRDLVEGDLGTRMASVEAG